MSWLKKKKTGITTQDKKEVPEGLFLKCDGCGEILYQPELEAALWTCPKCGHHFRITSKDYVALLADPGSFEERFTDLVAADPLEFRDARMRYPERYALAREATGLNDAVRTGPATIGGVPTALAVMDFFFMAGSMGSVLGEKVARTIELALAERRALVIVTASGGARMQEGILSLMQMAKTSALLATLKEQRLPFVSILIDPSMAGVMASYASLGDVILAEPGALIGFAGPRVIQDTIGEELPPGFQRSDFVLEHGMVDSVVHRKDMRDAVSRVLGILWQAARALPPAPAAVDAAYRP
jgi:acetyl-CoA carboxylase carboxyl transferase subunit beta